MSERLTDEQLRAVARFFTEESIEAAAVNEAIALRARVAKLEAALHDVLPYISSPQLKVDTAVLLDCLNAAALKGAPPSPAPQ